MVDLNIYTMDKSCSTCEDEEADCNQSLGPCPFWAAKGTHPAPIKDHKTCVDYPTHGYCSGKYPIGDTCETCPKYSIDAFGDDLAEGSKYDQGKTDMSFLEYFPLALEAVCKVSAFGGDKGYARGSFSEVQDARQRYTAAMLRHYFAEGPLNAPVDEDEESGLPHDYAVAWNALCRLELRLRNLK